MNEESITIHEPTGQVSTKYVYHSDIHFQFIYRHIKCLIIIQLTTHDTTLHPIKYHYILQYDVAEQRSRQIWIAPELNSRDSILWLRLFSSVSFNYFLFNDNTTRDKDSCDQYTYYDLNCD